MYEAQIGPVYVSIHFRQLEIPRSGAVKVYYIEKWYNQKILHQFGYQNPY